ncbi:DUF805 domain-containing protein [Roseiarcaceae bacterium H3SJ34-1]|uniref:DUF805 domain-containing protein n=1 Tax=Terripilifer ovatus TaxID=3032367 RepID=UPI003AB93ECB|nr:DUF805 domain-containing protein [Roseiarcaceae bacterium H3SJ34-1]
MNWKDLFLARDGRIPRLSFWIGMAVLLIFELIILAPAGVFQWDAATNPAPIWFRLLEFVVSLIVAYPCYAVLLKRLHDRNSAGTLALVAVALMLISDFVNIFWPMEIAGGLTTVGYIINVPLLLLVIALVIELGFRRGTARPNRFGSDPLASAP